MLDRVFMGRGGGGAVGGDHCSNDSSAVQLLEWDAILLLVVFIPNGQVVCS